MERILCHIRHMTRKSIANDLELEQLRDERIDLRIEYSVLIERTPEDPRIAELESKLMQVEAAIRLKERVQYDS